MLDGLSAGAVSRLESGARRPSESSTRRLAAGLRAGSTDVEVAMLDLELRGAAGPSLRRWRRRRPWSARRQRVYAQAALLLDQQSLPDPAVPVALARLAAALGPRWEPPR